MNEHALDLPIYFFNDASVSSVWYLPFGKYRF